MCRYFAYRGDPVPLSRWLFEAPHGLERQAYRPREMVSGHVNVDGTGLAWWNAGEREPLRYVFDGPPWADPNLPTLAPRIRSGVQLGAVRSATPGIGHGVGHLQPFVHTGGALAGAHNGWVGGFRGAVGQRMVGELEPALFEVLPALNDSAVLFLAVVQRALGGTELAAALAEAVAGTLELCRGAGEAASLNLVVSDLEQTVAVRASTGVAANSLYLSARSSGHLLASEPLDDGPWAPVPSGHLVTMTASGHRVTPLQPSLASTEAS